MGDIRQFDRLEVRGFRGLSALELIGMGNFNLLLGANDVGKTSILEAVLLVCSLSDPGISVRIQRGRDYEVLDIDGLLSVFYGLDFGREVCITARRGDSEYRKLVISAPMPDSSSIQKDIRTVATSNTQTISSRQSKVVDGQSSSAVNDSRMLQYDAEVRSLSQVEPSSFSVRLIDHGDKWAIAAVDSDNNRIEPAITARTPAGFLGPTIGYDTARIGKLVIGKKDEVLLPFLRIFNPRVSKMSVLEKTAYLDIGLKEMMPLNMFGSGMVRAATILSSCILKEVSVLLIDEIEYGLHYQAIVPLLEALIKLSDEMGVQIFATTHSIDVLKGLQKVLEKDDFRQFQSTTTCFAIQRDRVGGVRSYRYDHDQFDHCIRNEMEIR